MSSGHRTSVVLDTDVWSHLFGRRGRAGERVSLWRQTLIGHHVVIAVQTRAEVISGMRAAGWGASRTATVMVQLNATSTIPVDETVIEAYAALYAAALSVGHGIAAKDHVGDRWIAASAIAQGLPLLSGDRLFRGAPGLTLLEETHHD